MAKIFPITKILDKLTEYVTVKAEQWKLEIMGKVAKVLSVLIVFIVLMMIGFFFAILAGITLSVYLNHVLGSPYLGYVIVSGTVLLIIIIILLLLRTGKVQAWLESAILNVTD